ncbi:tape measure protein [Halomonas sp. DN3]|uniref:tape measure protein n=1 Tax=Halomonas sp. DN3 TaxID=2953657 RepID=UPI0020A21778|nr:tape measure protein [Halomonas sp. DN3]USZ48138.1 tape measure protein [Halomonas sp. DN3]
MPYSSRLELVIDSRSGERSLKRVERGLVDVDRAGDRAAGSLGGVAAETSRLRGVALAASGALAGLVGAASAGEVIRYADAWSNTTNQIRQVTSSSDELAKTQRELLQIANDSRSTYESTVDLYTRLEKSTQELGISSERLLGITDSINKSFALSGATADESAGAITQLAQGLAAGALRGDEFNSVAEQAPEIMRAISNSLDMTTGELKDFAAEGGITAQVIIDAMEGAAVSIDQAFGQSIATFGQKMAVSRNKILEWVGASEGLNDAVGLAGDAIVGLSDNIDTLVDGAQFLAVLMAGRLSGALATATAAKLAALGQTLAYQAALARLAGVSGTAATAQLAMGAAVRTASGAIALLGGPVGAAVVAAGGIYYFREELGLVQPKIESVTSTVDALTDSINMNSEAALKNGISKLSADIADLQRAAQTARAERDAIQMQGPGPGYVGIGPGAGSGRNQAVEAVRQIETEIASYDEAVVQLENRLESLGESSIKPTNSLRTLAESTSEADKATKELAESQQRLIDRLFPLEAAHRQFREEMNLLDLKAAADKTFRLAEAQERLRTQYSAELTGGFMEQIATGGLAEKVKETDDLTRDLGLTFSSAFEDAIVGGEGFREVLAGIAEDIARLAVRKSITEPAVEAISGFDWGGLIGSAFGSASGGSAFGASYGSSSAGSFQGFAEGGWTGPGGKYEPKGVVHGEEFVVRREVVKRPGVLPMLERLNNMPGYANGGLVGGSPTAISDTVVQVIDQRQGGAQPEVQESRSSDGRRQIRILIRDEVKSMFNDGTMDSTMSRNYRQKRRPL